jgi:hypothetical protein
MDLTDFYRVFHPAYTFIPASHGIFSQIDHILGHKVSLNKYKKTEITPHILSDHNTTKLDKQQKKQQKMVKYLETEQHIAP